MFRRCSLRFCGAEKKEFRYGTIRTARVQHRYLDGVRGAEHLFAPQFVIVFGGGRTDMGFFCI